MTKRERPPISRLVDAIATGRDVDWDAESTADPELRASLGPLRAVERIARAYRRAANSRWGKLEILERLGAGSFGEVYRALDTSLAIEVALKLWPTAGAKTDQLLAEARRLARVRHPNVLTVHGVDVHGGRVGMWTDLLRGHTLEELLAEQGPFGAEETASIGAQLCRALAALHRAGLIHRDVKATNVMREIGGRIVLLDFGIATEVATAVVESGEAAMTGTPLSMAPEQFAGGPATVASDIYALGVLLYRLACGRYPVEAPTLAELRAKHHRAESVPLRDRRPDLPIEFIRVVERALRPNPQERFESPGAMERALVAWVVVGHAAPATPPVVIGGPTSHSAFARRLPESRTSFIGRQAEIAECMARLEPGHILTLTGPGGCGKTRLSLRLAERLLERDLDDVAWVELAALEGPERLTLEVAKALDVREQPHRDLIEIVVARLQSSRAVLILDNCEHMITACAEFATTLLERCPQLILIATSRERLGISKENVHLVPPLSMPEDPAAGGVESVAARESIQLFMERAAPAQPDFRLTASNAGVVAEICRRLDGLPLGIELAAARLRMLSVHQVAEMLRDRFRLLAAGIPRSPAHHQTLWATFEWSYQQLSPDEQQQFRGLAVFAGGWNLEAAAAVWGNSDDVFAALDGLERLVDKSLVVVDPIDANQARYRLLETLREFGLKKLEAADEVETVRDRHAGHFLVMAEQLEPELWGGGQAAATARLEKEHRNILAALSWYESREDRARATRMVAGMARFWYARGYFSLGRELLDKWVASPSSAAPRSAVARATYGAAQLAAWQGDFPAADRLLQRALADFEALGEPHGIARCFNMLGNVAGARGDGEARRSSYEKSLAVYREIGDRRGIAVALGNLGVVASASGDLVRARTLIEEAVGHARAAGDRETMMGMLVNLGEISIQLGRPDEARRPIAEALHARPGLGANREVAYVLEGAAKLAAALDENERAARLFATADTLREAIGCKRLPREEQEQQAFVVRCREHLGEPAFAAARDAGREMPLEAAVTATAEWLDRDK